MGAEPSLLQRLSNHVLVLKDFTTVLELPHDERQGVLAQLREIHDDQFDKHWGTGKALNREGHVGFLAHRPSEPPDLDSDIRDWLVDLADLVTRARSPVTRERGGGALQYAHEPEVPARFAPQLYALAQGLVLVGGGTALTTADRQRLAQRAGEVPQSRTKTCARPLCCRA